MEQGSSGTSRERMVYAGIGLVFALLLAVYLVYKIAVVVLVLLVTLLFSIIISAPVDYLGRQGVGRGWGTLAVLGGLALLFGIFGVALSPVVASQATQLVDGMAQARHLALEVHLSRLRRGSVPSGARAHPAPTLPASPASGSAGAVADASGLGICRRTFAGLPATTV